MHIGVDAMAALVDICHVTNDAAVARVLERAQRVATEQQSRQVTVEHIEHALKELIVEAQLLRGVRP